MIVQGNSLKRGPFCRVHPSVEVDIPGGLCFKCRIWEKEIKRWHGVEWMIVATGLFAIGILGWLLFGGQGGT